MLLFIFKIVHFIQVIYIFVHVCLPKLIRMLAQFQAQPGAINFVDRGI